MNQLLTSPIFQVCALLSTVGVLYGLCDGRIDISIGNFIIKGKGKNK